MEKKNNPSAERFRIVRDLLGFTQQQLADELLLSRNYIAKIEAGIQEPSPRALVALESLRVRLSNRPQVDPSHRAAGSTSIAPTQIEAQLRTRFDALIMAAEGDPVRLGWIAEQQQAHLSIPAHWHAVALEQSSTLNLSAAHIKALAYNQRRRDRKPLVDQSSKITQLGAG